MLALFAAGILLPQHIDSLFGENGTSTDPRNFVGSSGATYFLASTLAAGLLLRGSGDGDGGAGCLRVANRQHALLALLALAVPTAGLAMWFAQGNGHGLVSVYGFVLGALVRAVARTVLRPDRDLQQPPKLTVGSLAGFLPGRTAHQD